MANSHLNGDKVNLSLLQESLKRKLLLLIDKCDGTKMIVWDEALEKPMRLLITGSKQLKEHNVISTHLLKFGKLPNKDVKNVVYIARAQERLMDVVSDNVKMEERSGIRKEHHLFFVPRMSTACRKRLSEKGVYGNFTFLEDLEIDIFPFDYDLLSMEVDHTFKDLYLFNDPTSLHQAARALQTIQNIYGPITNVTGKGEAATQVYNIMRRLANEPNNFPSVSLIDHLVLLDRSVDVLTPLLTQLTYEGLVDELFNIKYNTVLLPSEKFEEHNEESSGLMTTQKQVIVNSGDPLYAEIRDISFSAVGPVLNEKMSALKAELGEKDTNQSIDKLRQFVAKLPTLMANKESLGIHVKVAEMIKEFIETDEFLDKLKLEQSLLLGIDCDKVQTYVEDLIAREEPLVNVLKLICIQSATNSGLKPKVLEYYKREIVQTYGFENILLLSRLEDAGLLKIQTNTRWYTVLNKTLNLIVEDGSESSPKDFSYVHAIYAPLSVRLVQRLVRFGSWASLNDVLPLLPGQSIHHNFNSANPARRASIDSQVSAQTQNDSPPVIMVFFLGGCTYSEIAALRFLASNKDRNVEIIIATTKIINGSSFINSLCNDPIS